MRPVASRTRIGALLVLLLIGLLLLARLVRPVVIHLIDSDRCLDRGGRWDYEAGHCDEATEPQPEQMDDQASGWLAPGLGDGSRSPQRFVLTSRQAESTVRKGPRAALGLAQTTPASHLIGTGPGAGPARTRPD